MSCSVPKKVEIVVITGVFGYVNTALPIINEEASDE
jgi:hypothetical protein